MGQLETQLKRAESLSPQAITIAIFEHLKKLEPFMIGLNKGQIFESSEDIFGNPLGYYSRATEYITTNDALLGKKTRIKREGEPYDFLQEGHFLGGLYAKASRDFITFGTSDPKLEDVLDNPRLLSKSFFGLTDENKKKLIQEKLTPFLLVYLRQKLKV